MKPIYEPVPNEGRIETETPPDRNEPLTDTLRDLPGYLANVPTVISDAIRGGPAPAIRNRNPTSQRDVRMAENRMPGYTPPAPAPVAAATDHTSVAPATSESPFTMYQSQSMPSQYDEDIQFAHHVSRMAAMAGMGQESMAYLDLYFGMNNQRRNEVTQNAQKAFLGGDLTGFINVYNHEVPNNRKITGYRKNPDNTYALQYADGNSDTVTQAHITTALQAFNDPKLISVLLQNQAKQQGEIAGHQLKKLFDASVDIETAKAKGLIDYQKQAALEILKNALPSKDMRLSSNQLGEYVAFSGRQAFKWVPGVGLGGAAGGPGAGRWQPMGEVPFDTPTMPTFNPPQAATSATQNPLINVAPSYAIR